MPAGPMGYMSRGYGRAKTAASKAFNASKNSAQPTGPVAAQRGKMMSNSVAAAKRRPGRTIVGGSMGLGAAGYLTSGRRGRGTDRVNGRPTGIRRY